MPSDPARYSLQPEPVVRDKEATPEPPTLPDLPRSYRGPIIFAIARDPRTLFAYWDVDWAKEFEEGNPEDQKAHVRVLNASGGVESSAAVEPTAGNVYLRVGKPRATYSLELGFYRPGRIWKIVCRSDAVTTPPEGLADTRPVDVATVPYHLSFQRLIETLEEAPQEAAAAAPVAQLIAQVQRKATAAGLDSLSTGESELLRMISEVAPDSQDALERFERGESFNPAQIEALLRAGVSSGEGGASDTSSWTGSS